MSDVEASTETPSADPGRPVGTAPVDPSVTPPHHERIRNQRGEGVISTAIAVLVVAFIGIGLWRGFDAMVNSASQRTRTQVEQIGR